jgi:hypothetical protein
MRLSLPEVSNERLIPINADDGKANLGKNRGERQSHIAKTKNCVRVRVRGWGTVLIGRRWMGHCLIYALLILKRFLNRSYGLFPVLSRPT